MSQFLTLAGPKSAAGEADARYVFRQLESVTLVMAARRALGVRGADEVFTVTSPSGDPFETWFDALPFDAERTNQLVDVCARSFAALALFYGEPRDLQRTDDLHQLKRIIARQFKSVPVELYVAWSE